MASPDARTQMPGFKPRLYHLCDCKVLTISMPSVDGDDKHNTFLINLREIISTNKVLRTVLHKQ